MNLGQPCRIGQIGLSEWKFAGVAVDKSCPPQAEEDLADEMRHALQSRALTQIHRPFALNGGIDKRLPPQGGGDARISRADLVEEVAREISNRNRSNGADRMIHLTQDEDVEIAHVAREEERDHLSPAVLELLVTTGPARED